MSDRREIADNSGGPVLGPIIGFRRPNYGVLDAVLAPFIQSAASTGAGEVCMMINLGSALRQMYSEYVTERATQGELQQWPYYLAAELVNLAGHYRNYVWSRHNMTTTMVMYHSTKRCADKAVECPDYKAAFYSKRMQPNSPELEMMRRYVDANLQAAREVVSFIPNMHIIDTGALDPEAWPWQAIHEGRIPNPAIVMSGWDSDLQYALAECAGHPVGVLRASGQNTSLVTRGSVVQKMIGGTKSMEEFLHEFAPEHIMYLIALMGEKDLGVEGVRGMGPGRAAKAILGQIRRGKLTGQAPTLRALLEDSFLKSENEADVRRSWGALIHRDYCRVHATPSRMDAIAAQCVDRFQPGAISEANSKFFGRTPFDVRMATAGEGVTG